MVTRGTADPPTQVHVVPGEDGTFNFTGELLAHVSSRWQTHNHPGTSPGDARCSACRWTEVEIFRTRPESVLAGVGSALATYLVVTRGCSSVPGERVFVKSSWTDSPYEVVEILTQRKNGQVFLPGPAARALSRAAEYDDGVNDAYVNRAVS